MGEHDFKLNVDSLIERLLEGECNLAFHCQTKRKKIFHAGEKKLQFVYNPKKMFV